MRRSTTFLILAAYLAISVLLFSNGITTGTVFQPGTDPAAYIWFLNWWPYAISHGINPFMTQYVWSPIGFSMLWVNSMPTLGLLAWPVTTLFGAETTWNILCLIAPALNAFTAFLLIRYLVRDWRGAFVGGLIFGFSPYVGSHMLGHLSLTFVPLVPLLALVAVRRARGEIGRSSFVSMLTTMVVLQFGISMEVLATTAFFGAIAYISFFLKFRHSLDMRGLATDTVISAVICAVILTPAFYFLWLGIEQLPDVINSPITFSNDLLGFIVPMKTVWAGGAALAHFTSKFSATASEQNAYLGLPMIALAVVAFRSMRSESWTKPLASVTIIAAIASLGPALWIGGHLIRIPLPGAITMFVPLLKHSLPGRFALYTSLGIAILVATWLVRGSSRIRYAQAALATIFILPNPFAFSFVSYSTPEVFANSLSATDLGKRGAVISLPYGQDGYSNLWQLRSNMRFKMAGGYIGSTPRFFGALAVTDYLSGKKLPTSQDEFRRNILAFCLATDVGSIVVGPGTPPPLKDRLQALNWPSRTEGNSEIILPPASAHDEPFRSVFGDRWDANEGKMWLGKIALVVNNEPTPMHLSLSRGSTPAKIGPILIYVVYGSHRDSYYVDESGTTVTIPPWSHAELISKSTWVPAHYMPGNDSRRLSVMAEIK
jgi:hypothetical protein